MSRTTASRTRTAATPTRADRRKADELRPITLTRRTLKYALGSCLVEWGDTKVLCSVSLEERVPPFLKGTGKGWVSAEYGMLPGCSRERIAREATKGRPSGRTQEIQRLIGRSLRTVVDLPRLGERMLWVDCDVLQADGGTRCAAVTGAFVALADGLRALRTAGTIPGVPLRDFVSAVSVGMVKGRAVVDLPYEEDARADVDMNVVMTGAGKFIEVQGTAEREPFSGAQLTSLLRLAARANQQVIAFQRAALDVRTIADL